MRRLLRVVWLTLFVLVLVLLACPVSADHCQPQAVQRNYAPAVRQYQAQPVQQYHRQQVQHHQAQQVQQAYPFAIGYGAYPGVYSLYSPDLSQQLQQIKLENELLRTQNAVQQMQQQMQQQYQQLQQRQPLAQPLQQAPQQQAPDCPDCYPTMPGASLQMQSGSLVQARCARCHDQQASAQRGGGLVLWSQGRAVRLQSALEQQALAQALESGTMPKGGGKLTFGEKARIYQELTQ